MNDIRFAKASPLCILILCATVVCQTTTKMSSTTDDNEKILDHKVSLPDTTNVQPWILFQGVLRSAHVPGGIVLLSRCSHVEAARNYSFAASTLKLRDALDAVTALDDQTHWVLSSGAITLEPKVDKPDILNVRLAHFQLSKSGTSVSLASGELFRSPEVIQALEHLQLTANNTNLVIGSGSWHQPDILLDLHDVTVEEALNAIAAKHGYAVWSYSEFHCNGKNEFSVEWVTR